MRATSLGHAGILIDTVDGSIVCDPWFLPAFRTSWFVFPRNDHLDAALMQRIEQANYLYISHLHADHFDEPWLADHLSRDITVLLPDYPTRELERRIRAFGFDNVVRTTDTQELPLGPSLRVAVHVETSITDGPGGDSALVVSDGTGRIVNQNDCRTADLGALRGHGPVDLHWLQYSGAIWYPMVYEQPDEIMRAQVAAKVDSQYTRAMRYVEALDARAVVPSAGPPCFLDPELFEFNVIDGDEVSIFPDQREFLARLESVNRRGILAVPGTEIDITPTEITVRHPQPDAEVARIFTHKREYLQHYQSDWMPAIVAEKLGWHRPTDDLVSTLQAWWQPLMAMAPTVCAGVSDRCLLQAGDLEVLIDFPNAQVRAYAGEPYGFRFTIQRELVETVVAERAVDWSNSLFLSCRFRAWRNGPFNEYVYNFFKSLSTERMRRAEAEALRRLDPDRSGLAGQEIVIGEYIVERTCPHRQADLSVFGEIDGDQLVCTLHGWRFDLDTGRCVNAIDRVLRVRRADCEPLAEVGETAS